MGTLYLLSPEGTQSEHDEDQVRIQWQQGQLKATTLCWKEGFKDWTPLPFYFSSIPKAPAPSAPTPTHAGGRRRYSLRRDSGLLLATVLVMLSVVMVVKVFVMMGNYHQYTLLDSGPVDPEVAYAHDTRQSNLGKAYTVTFLVTGIVFLRWVHRANYNSHCFGARDMAFSPGWSIGWYFVPFMNFYKPYLAMLEIWKVSLNPHKWQSQRGSFIVGFWWSLWLLMVLINQISRTFVQMASDTAAFKQGTVLLLISDAVYFPLCLSAALVLCKIHSQQQKLVQLS